MGLLTAFALAASEYTRLLAACAEADACGCQMLTLAVKHCSGFHRTRGKIAFDAAVRRPPHCCQPAQQPLVPDLLQWQYGWTD